MCIGKVSIEKNEKGVKCCIECPIFALRTEFLAILVDAVAILTVRSFVDY